jgi:hypothetical protein
MQKWEYRTIYFEWSHNLITSEEIPVTTTSSQIVDTHGETTAQFDGAALPIHETINALGAEGWELVNVTRSATETNINPDFQITNTQVAYIFKRPLEA